MKKNHKNPHKTPEGYFESFNERLMDKIAKEESIIPKSDGFSVPDTYFETFNERVAHKVEPKVVQLYSYRKYYYAAASVAAIALLAFFFNQSTQPEFGFDDLATTEIDAYFENNEMGLTSYELAEVVNIENVAILDITETENDIEKEMILEYLDENVDELEDLNLDYEEFE
ncbi:hypothetical protein MTsPCn9_03250 [Croceitalea sp. MTPC9]|uniref:hypothetical protein n=1 Tax=unclassified Croceitalea TaxID=2632280 RepID=UPI002B39FB44|nr:hypothetical protein MTsPCn6_05460 [Croceitalea sp. MTPC6]GMN15389.1 hypothetical protein MTsPCn9_03250 [Croceitalea sp. MTPC9]